MVSYSGIAGLVFLNRERSCTCGHSMTYHVKGRAECIFGMCDCKRYNL